MEKIAQFYKVSEEQFINDWRAATGSSVEEAKSVYANIRLPRRATKGSAGYDFFAPESFTLVPHETILIPTGIRVMIEDGWVLQLYPRSGLGFRHRLQLDNTVGVIDSDYFEAKNEGHILIKMTSDDLNGKMLSVQSGDAFAQGISKGGFPLLCTFFLLRAYTESRGDAECSAAVRPSALRCCSSAQAYSSAVCCRRAGRYGCWRRQSLQRVCSCVKACEKGGERDEGCCLEEPEVFVRHSQIHFPYQITSKGRVKPAF